MHAFLFVFVLAAKAGPRKPKVGDDINLADVYHPWADMDAVPVHVASDEHLISDYLLAAVRSGDSIGRAVELFESYSKTMTLGDEKGRLLEAEVGRIVPTNKELVFLEFGSHIGDGTLRILKALDKKKCTVFSFEANQQWLGIGMGIVRHVLASAGNFACKYVPLMLTKDIAHLCDHIRQEYGVKQIDGVLFDHDHSKFLRDLQVLRDKKMLRQGTLIMADNALRHKSAMRGFLEYTKTNSQRWELVSISEPYSDQVLVSEWNEAKMHGDEL